MMTDTETKIRVLKECMEAVNAVPLTEMAPDFQILYSTLPHVDVMALFMEMESERQGFEYQSAVKEMESRYHGSTNVNVFTNFLGMAWISDIWFEEGAVKRIYMLGPVFLDDYSVGNLEKRLDELELSLPLKHRFMKYILSTPVVSLSRFYEYGIMLHYCVTGEKISAYDFIYPDYQKKEADDEIFSVKHGTYLAEQELLKMVEDGNLEYGKIMEKNLFTGSGGGLRNSGYLRQEQNRVITLTVLCSRAAIRG
ncbi:MAG: hypothetical protein LUE87_06545, partial [Lachnospiraceae bacterium]|nr:hypothetical protein [Lachnospiraceae bacterium]